MQWLPVDIETGERTSVPTTYHVISCVDDPPPSSVYENSQINVHSRTTAMPEGGLPHSNEGLRGVTSLVTRAWKNPRYFRWIMTIAISFLFANIVGFVNNFGSLYLCLRRDLHSTATETGWVASLTWALLILSPAVTACYQRFGPRKMVLSGILFTFVGLLSSSFVDNIWPMFITFGIVFGVGINIVYVTSINLVASYFDQNECALPITLPGIGATIGMLITSPVLEIAYNRFGWRATLRFLASSTLLFGIAISFLYKSPPSPPKAASMEHMNNNQSVPTKDHNQKLRKDEQKQSRKNYRSLIKDPFHWMFCLATMLAQMVLLINVVYLVELMAAAGYSGAKSAMFMSIMGAVDTAFRFLLGIFGDRISCARVLIIPFVTMLNGIGTFTLTMSTQPAIMISYICVVALARCIMYSTIFPASVEIFGHAVHQEAFAMLIMASGIGCLLGAVVPGLSFDLTGSYVTANYCGAAVWLIASVLYVAVFVTKKFKDRSRCSVGRPHSLSDGHRSVEFYQACTDDNLERVAEAVEGALESPVSDLNAQTPKAKKAYYVIIDKVSSV